MVVLYDSWNKLKSYSVLNRQGFEELVKTYNLNAKVDPAMSQAFEKRLDASAIASLKVIDEAQNALEVRFDIREALTSRRAHLSVQKKGLKVVSSGVRRPTKLQQAIVESTRQYDVFLEKNLIAPLVKRDLAFKHQSMAADSFQFLRATFFRFIQIWPVLLPGLSAAPHGALPPPRHPLHHLASDGVSQRLTPTQCSPSVTSTLRTTAPGATPRVAGYGA